MRIAWDQQVDNATELAAFTYILYIDGSPVPLPRASCAALDAGTVYTCTAQLPPLSPGVHRLQVAASSGAGAEYRESGPSDPLVVSVSEVNTSNLATRKDSARGTASASDPDVAAEVIVSGLKSPTDVAFGDERLLFVAERRGSVRVVQDGQLIPGTVLQIDDVQHAPDGALLSLAVDPQFSHSGLIYVVYAYERDAGGLAYRLARVQYRNGVFGEPTVLLDEVPAASSNLAAAVRFGPDGKLYVALADAEENRHVLSSFNGKVLRLNPDGSTPRDQRAASPVYVSGVRVPRAMTWDAENDLWLLDTAPDGQALIQVSSGDGRATAHPLPERVVAESMAFYDGNLVDRFRGALLMPDGFAGILRVSFDRRRQLPPTFHSSDLPELAAARVLAISRAGEIYMTLADRLLRVLPAR